MTISIKSKLIILFLAAALIPVVFVGIITFSNYKKSLETAHLSALKDIAAFKVDKIDTFFAGLKANIRMAQGFYNIKKNLPILTRLASDTSNPEFSTATKMLDGQLQLMQRVLGLFDIMLLSPEGRIVYAVNPEHNLKPSLDLLSAIQRSVLEKAKDKVCISDIFFYEINGNKPEILMTVPAFDFDGAFIGIIAFEINTAPFYILIQGTTGLGDTGETLICKKIGNEAVFLNPLRYDPQAAFKKKIRLGDKIGIPMQMAAQGSIGAGRSIDYRGREVVAAWHYIPSLDWGVVAKIDTSEIFADVIKLRKMVAIIVLIISVLGSVVALSISMTISGPVENLSKGVKIIGDGNFGYMIQCRTRDEIGRLCGAFNQMAYKLKESQKLSQANERLKELNNRKSAFVANVSHEFKNPLTILRESLDIISEGIICKIGPQDKDMLEMGKRNIDRLMRLVTDLLDISKIEAGKMELKKEKINIESLVNEILDNHEKDISKKDITLKKDISEGMGAVLADKDRLIQVFINLLSNAIKYTPAGGIIAIKLLGDESEVRFEMSNTGPSIAKENLEKIFDKFERITAESQEGTGLGLSIARDIIGLHEGRLWAESELGKGSKFIFTIPRK